ncbi:response regulator [Achromobacter spanius]|nr:response regulator [Achromobacter spanius]
MRVLIVDDDSTTAELTAECLMMDPGVSVRTTGDGAGALLAMAEFMPDVVLLDVELPDASGLDLAPKLKSFVPGRVPRIIIFSGSVQGSDPLHLPNGVDAWLTKPAHLSTLLDCIFRPTGWRTP